MDTQQTVIEILTSFGEGDKALQNDQYSSAVLTYKKAIQLLMSLPETEPFDRLVFVASCIAGTAMANVQLGNNELALQTAEKALSFFDKNGKLYPAEYGKWLLAILSKGIALAELGRRSEAIHQRDRAEKMLREPLTQSAGTQKFQKQITQCIKRLDDCLQTGPSKNKSWWKFWK